MIFIRMAENAETVPTTIICRSVVHAMAYAHKYVWAKPNRIATVVNTSIAWPNACGCDYTQNGNYLEDVMPTRMYERFYNTTL